LEGSVPLLLPSSTLQIAPALAAGCTIVAKPSEITPTTASLLAEASKRAGLPDGVLNIVHGLGGDVGSEIVSHPDVAAVSFTGGTATGKLVASNAAPHFKKVVLPSPLLSLSLFSLP
jgi:aminomuconate-semialdehyde/2-hydroxymuconate-6-semialdehyde dehydrogenase